MIEAADFAKRPDLASRSELDGPDVGCVLRQREVRTGLVIVT